MVMWAGVADLEDSIGPQADIERAERLLTRATAIIAQHIGWPLVDMEPSAVPANVREAIITLASRALTATAGGGDVIQEAMGSFSYRLATPPKADSALYITPDIAAILRPYRGDAASVTVCCGGRGRYYGDNWTYMYGPDMRPLSSMAPFSPPLVGSWVSEEIAPSGETIVTVNFTSP